MFVQLDVLVKPYEEQGRAHHCWEFLDAAGPGNFIFESCGDSTD